MGTLLDKQNMFQTNCLSSTFKCLPQYFTIYFSKLKILKNFYSEYLFMIKFHLTFLFTHLSIPLGLPRWFSGKESPCQCRKHKRYGFDLWVSKIPWSGKWQPLPVFLPVKFHRQRSLVLQSMGLQRVVSTTQQLKHSIPLHVNLHGFPGSSVVTNPPTNAGDASSIPGLGRSAGGGNGNALHYSCLKNPTDRGA